MSLLGVVDGNTKNLIGMARILKQVDKGKRGQNAFYIIFRLMMRR
jgi:hypothetical protein